MRFERSWTGNWENAFHGLRHPMESYAKGDTAWYDDTPTNENLCGNQAIEIDSINAKFLGIGPNDLDLAQRMIKAGSPNDKFLRQIFVSVDITAPLYLWKELDTYKVGTTANSTSTMHKLASTPITIDCFEIDDFNKNLGVGLWACAGGKEYISEPDYNNPIENGYFQEEDEKTGKITKYATFYTKDYNRDSITLENIIEGQINFLERLRQLYFETKDIRYWKELIRWLPESWLQTRTWTANYTVLRNIIHWRRGHKLTEWGQFIEWCKSLPYAKELLFYNQSFDN